MKTPEEIKKGLECCANEGVEEPGCAGCPYDSGGRSCGSIFSDALTYIRQLERELDAKEKKTMKRTEILCDICGKEIGRDIFRKEDALELRGRELSHYFGQEGLYGYHWKRKKLHFCGVCLETIRKLSEERIKHEQVGK